MKIAFCCDRGWIQTSNLLSRNQVRYSVAPRGLFCECKDTTKKNICKRFFTNFKKISYQVPFWSQKT